jgi:hypothetical protein
MLTFDMAERLGAIDTLQHAHDYIGAQFERNMPQAKAIAHFETRSILRRTAEQLMQEIGTLPVRKGA